jgi:hypothetical protein
LARGNGFFPDYKQNPKNEDIFISLNPQLFEEMETQRKTVEYQSYWLFETK